MDQALHDRVKIDHGGTFCLLGGLVRRCGLFGSRFGFSVFGAVLVCFVVRFRCFGDLFVLAT